MELLVWIRRWSSIADRASTLFATCKDPILFVAFHLLLLFLTPKLTIIRQITDKPLSYLVISVPHGYDYIGKILLDNEGQ